MHHIFWKKATFRFKVPTFDSFSYFQTSFALDLFDFYNCPTPLVPPVPLIPPAPPSSAGPAVGKVLGKSDDRSNRWLDLFDINRKMIREKRLRTTKLTMDGSKLKIKGPKYVYRVPNSWRYLSKPSAIITLLFYLVGSLKRPWFPCWIWHKRLHC